MIVRPYQDGDREAVLEIAREQGLRVDIPFPESDPATISALVGVEGERIVLAIFGRLSVEAHCVIRPEEPQGAHKIKRVMETSEGYIMSVSDRMVRFGFPAVLDAQAYVPSWMEKFKIVMERFLGWLPEPEGYKVYYKRLGTGNERG